jgi:uncharacterized protein DUF4258
MVIVSSAGQDVADAFGSIWDATEMFRLPAKILGSVIWGTITGGSAEDHITEYGYSGHARERMAERGISEDMVEQTIRNGKKGKGNSPATDVFSLTFM